MKEYEIEHLSRHETVKRYREQPKHQDSGIDLLDSEKSPLDFSEDLKPTSNYEQYTENGKE